MPEYETLPIEQRRQLVIRIEGLLIALDARHTPKHWVLETPLGPLLIHVASHRISYQWPDKREYNCRLFGTATPSEGLDKFKRLMRQFWSRAGVSTGEQPGLLTRPSN